MKDVRVVVRTSNMKISRHRLADYVKTMHQKACRTIIFPLLSNQIKCFLALPLPLPLPLESLSNHDDDGNKNPTNLHI